VPYATLLQMFGPRNAVGCPSAPSSSIGSYTSSSADGVHRRPGVRSHWGGGRDRRQ